MHHSLLSKDIEEILREEQSDGALTLNSLMQRTEGRGIYLVIILCALPFVIPVSIPGFSALLGTTVAVLGVRLALGKPARLPKFMGERKLSPAFRKKVLGGSVKILRLVEKLIRPRGTAWMKTRLAVSVNALLLTILGLLLALPFPPLPPFTNSFPSYSLILIATAMMEEDGLVIWIGYAVSVGTTLYLFLVTEGLQIVFVKLYHVIVQFLQR